MKTLNQYIQEKLIINKDYKDVKMYHPKSFDELRNIIEDRYKKFGHGTKQNPVDFNDIDISNIDSFCGKYDTGIFEYTRFKYIDISYWNVSNVKSMSYMFAYCEKLKSVGDLSNWDVSSVMSTHSVFSYCIKLKSFGDISGWDVSNVNDMGNMFECCESFNQDISDWDVSNVTNMSFMFCWCESFNQDISKWNVSNVRNNHCMFDNCPIKEEYKPKFK